eukprot:scaffold26915_cov71-Attheya_sp.AAC.2
MSQLFGSANITLRYIYHEHMAVTDMMQHAKMYSSYHKCFAAIMVFSRSRYTEDNEMVWQEIKPLVVDGSGWTFVQSFEKARNGRGAFLALKAQNGGDNSMLICKKTAYLALSTLVFNGSRKTLSFWNYIEGHQKAHNELHDCKEPVSDTKKVSDFLQSITDPMLVNDIDNVYGNQADLPLDSCYQHQNVLLHTMRLNCGFYGW